MPDNESERDPNGRSRLNQLAQRFAALDCVMAVVFGGSRGSHGSDVQSDFDIYVYTSAEIPIEFRRTLLGAKAEIDNRFWEPGDEGIVDGLQLDVMYRSPKWIEDQLDRILARHQASVGYTTCFWFNVLNSEPLWDRGRWFQQLRERVNIPYPEQLRRAIVAKNWPILRRNQSSYRRQIELALERDDAVSVQHRVTALLASFFDVWFALQREPHPGEKRLLGYLPGTWAQLVRGMVEAPVESLLERIDGLLDSLDMRLREEGLAE
jgi:predicted nucleotidyltransferase